MVRVIRVSRVNRVIRVMVTRVIRLPQALLLMRVIKGDTRD